MLPFTMFAVTLSPAGTVFFSLKSSNIIVAGSFDTVEVELGHNNETLDEHAAIDYNVVGLLTLFVEDTGDDNLVAI